MFHFFKIYLRMIFPLCASLDSPHYAVFFILPLIAPLIKLTVNSKGNNCLSNNCRRFRYKNIQSYRKPLTCFGLFCHLQWGIRRRKTKNLLIIWCSCNCIFKHDVQCRNNNIEASSCNHCCCRKAIIITYSDGVIVALCTQHVVRIRLTVIRGLPGSTILFHKQHDIRKKKSLHVKCVFQFSLQLRLQNFTL